MSHLARERRGAHRPRGLGVVAALPWLVAAIAIVAIVSWGVGWWGGADPPSSDNTVKAGPSSTSSATTRGSTSTRATSSGTSSATARPTSTADRTQSIAVLNSTGRSGLAAGAATTLRTAGWTIRATGNASGDGVTTVYFGKDSLKATAQAVADDLGAPARLTQSTQYGASRVTVVLGTDYPA